MGENTSESLMDLENKGFTDHIWRDKTKVPQSSCISSSVQKEKDYVSGTEIIFSIFAVDELQ